MKVNTLKPERTFWEKISLLHSEFHRPSEKDIPSRLSRHYYDIAMMGRNKLLQSALDHADLLQSVMANQKTFFPSAWAAHDSTSLGNLKLAPTAERRQSIRNDYKQMEEMFFDTFPSFDELMGDIQNIEERINDLSEL